MNLLVYSLMIFGILLLPACREDSPEAVTSQLWRGADGLDTEGYDALGFKEGFDRQGFDSLGCDKEGNDRIGYPCADIKKLKEHAVTWEKHDEIAKDLDDEKKQLTSLKNAADASKTALKDKIQKSKNKRIGAVTKLQTTEQQLNDEKTALALIHLELRTKDKTLKDKDEDLTKVKDRAEKLDDEVKKKEKDVELTQKKYEKELKKALKAYKEGEKVLAEKVEQLEEKLDEREDAIEKLQEHSLLLSEKANETEKKLTQYIADATEALSIINDSLREQKVQFEIKGENLAESISLILAAKAEEYKPAQKTLNFANVKEPVSPSKLKPNNQTQPNKELRMSSLTRSKIVTANNDKEPEAVSKDLNPVEKLDSPSKHKSQNQTRPDRTDRLNSLKRAQNLTVDNKENDPNAKSLNLNLVDNVNSPSKVKPDGQTQPGQKVRINSLRRVQQNVLTEIK